MPPRGRGGGTGESTEEVTKTAMLFGRKRHFNATAAALSSMPGQVTRRGPTAGAEGALISRSCRPLHLLEMSSIRAGLSSPEMRSRLSHTDARGHVRMVDVGAKPETARQAVATAAVKMALSTLELVMGSALSAIPGAGVPSSPKGDILATARLAASRRSSAPPTGFRSVTRSGSSEPTSRSTGTLRCRACGCG